MQLAQKLKILGDAAKFDVSCASSGVDKSGGKGRVGSSVACGICHSFTADGRCISLLKVLLTNCCINDCKYCINRISNDVERASFEPRELADLTINFYRRNYIEGLFLSSGIIKNADYTSERMYRVLDILRNEYNFNGYIHVKAIPGASRELIHRLGLLADRISVNIELPSERSLNKLAPQKSKDLLIKPMGLIKSGIEQSRHELTVYRHAPKFAPAGQSTQMIVGATDDTDAQILRLAEALYKKYSLKRVYYSAYIPVGAETLPKEKPPLLREHRLYQADWLLRYYGFTSSELFDGSENLDLTLDPKCAWALKNLYLFPVEVNTADYAMLLRVPGIGVVSAKRICTARKCGPLDFDALKKLGVVLKRAKYFITCKGKMMVKANEGFIYQNLIADEADKRPGDWEQLSFLPTKEDVHKCLTGQL